jgi:ribosomal protein S14
VTSTARAAALRVSVACTCETDSTIRVESDSVGGLPRELRCARCGAARALRLDLITASGGLNGCLVCGHPELYTRKDFPRALGLCIVVLAAILAPWTHYVSLGVAAVLDFLLYRLTSNVVACYVCGAEHRGFAVQPRHPRFDREIAERLRFGSRAVMGKPMRASGTADAPEPEH